MFFNFQFPFSNDWILRIVAASFGLDLTEACEKRLGVKVIGAYGSCVQS